MAEDNTLVQLLEESGHVDRGKLEARLEAFAEAERAAAEKAAKASKVDPWAPVPPQAPPEADGAHPYRDN